MKSNPQKLKSTQSNVVKNWVKVSLKCLPDYTEGEEKFLICDATNLAIAKLLTLKEFDKNQVRAIKFFVKQRLKGKPLNKISKRAYFYGEEFFVNNFVLSPRKETEILVEQVINFCKNISSILKEDTNQIKNVYNVKECNNSDKVKKLQILDLCCGSGAIGLTLAKNLSNSFVTLSDVSQKALNVSKKNRKKLNVLQNTKILKSNLFKGLKRGQTFDIIVSNPPYIATSELESLQKGVKKYEPTLALDGGQDGLKFYKIIAKESQKYLNKNGKIFLEIGFNQKEDVCAIFKENGFKTDCIKDYSGLDRVIIASI